MRTLFITTVPPFPPVDGVRIPEAHHLIALRKLGKVDCLLLKGTHQTYSPEDIEATRGEVDELHELRMRPRPKAIAYLDEIFRRQPFYGRWYPDEAVPSAITAQEYDLVWCGTAPAVAILARPEIRKLFRAKRYVAGLSDVHSLVLTRNAASADKSKSAIFRYIKNPIYRLRSRILKSAEKEIYSRYDMITVQTQREHEWIVSMDKSLAERLLILPNGVNKQLFELMTERREMNLCFVGLVFGLYRERVQWFFDNSWPQIKKRFPQAKATVVGKGAPEQLQAYLRQVGVTYTPFVENLEDIYRNQTVMIAPIFKGYGIINKVLEAMASACLVIGDKTAFNGIEGFEPGRHGLVANDAHEFAEQVCTCFESGDFLQDIRLNSRSIIQRNFSWETRYASITQRLATLSTNPNA